MELNIPVPKLKIGDSVSFCADAWKAVTSRTIHNCWKKTGILPSFAASPLSFDDDNKNSDDNENGDNEIDDEIDEVQKLLDQYNNFTSGELISAKEFILIDDDDNYGEEEITDEEIIKMVKPNEEEIEDDSIPQPKISTSVVLESLDKVLTFLDNPPDGFTTEFNNGSILYNLKKQIILFDKNNRVQSVLTNWLEI